MTFLAPFQKEIVSFALTLMIAFILWLVRAKAKLVWSRTHGFTFIIRPDPAPPSPPSQAEPANQPAPIPISQPFNIATGSFYFANTGRMPANNVEITFNWRPSNFQIWPVRRFETFTQDERFTVKFDTMSPHEEFQIELHTAGQLPNVLSVRCDECVGKEIRSSPQRVWPMWFIVIRAALLLLGLTAAIYFAISAAIALLR